MFCCDPVDDVVESVILPVYIREIMMDLLVGKRLVAPNVGCRIVVAREMGERYYNPRRT
jgi:hypothetical protein